MPEQPLRILHCLRAPVGGLFRHVRDLAREQAARGHEVGIICDANANDPLTKGRLADITPALNLGLHRVPMSREVGFSDLATARQIKRIGKDTSADVIHGHGAKGGAYARYATHALKRRPGRVVAFYTPHGGSLHYDPTSLKGRAFMAVERRLLGLTDGLIFESAYAARTFATKVGQPGCPWRVIHNGLLPEELNRLVPAPDATEFLFIGELRHLKGIDLLLEALAILAEQHTVRVTIVGSGPDAAAFRKLACELGVAPLVRFRDAMPARQAFSLGRILVMPSRAESLPYIALEAAGAGLPLIASNVGGMPEIVAGTDTALVQAGDSAALAKAMRDTLAGEVWAIDRAARLREAIGKRFTVRKMTTDILAFYAEALAADSLDRIADQVRAASHRPPTAAQGTQRPNLFFDAS